MSIAVDKIDLQRAWDKMVSSTGAELDVFGMTGVMFDAGCPSSSGQSSSHE
jgi:hypothetical protein